MRTRRGVITTLGITVLAGCTGSGSQPTTQESDSQNESQSESADTDANSGNPLTGEEVYFNWIHGEEEQILEEVQGTGPGSISFKAINNALEEGIEDGRDQAIANALETASEQYTTEFSYEDRHRHILSALHQTLEQKEGEQWDFQIFSNMNYTQTGGETIQYSEIKVQTGDTTDSGHQEYSIINAALKDEYNHATHTPGEQTRGDYQQTLYAARKSSLTVATPPQDVEGMKQSGSTEEDMAAFGSILGYQIFDGGHEVDDNYEFRPDEMLVPTEDAHKIIDEVGYEQGDRKDQNGDQIATHGEMSLQLAINERYFNQGYQKTDKPVVISNIERADNGWNFDLEQKPGWSPNQGYPEPAS